MNLFSCAAERLTELRERVAYTGKTLLERSRKWRCFSTKPPSNCDVVVTFERDTREEQVEWLSNRIQARIPELIFTKTFHRGTQRIALYLTCSFKDPKVTACFHQIRWSLSMSSIPRTIASIKEEDLYLVHWWRCDVGGQQPWLVLVNKRTIKCKFRISVVPGPLPSVVNNFHKCLLKGAQEVRLRKRLTADLGEELQEFCIEDCENFEGVFDRENFFTSKERQTIVRYYLMSLRAMAGDAWDDHIQFSHGQAIISTHRMASILVGLDN
ncbi:hypothetical protein ACTXT7_006980 [Hymenolepis weldensis]